MHPVAVEIMIFLARNRGRSIVTGNERWRRENDRRRAARLRKSAIDEWIDVAQHNVWESINRRAAPDRIGPALAANAVIVRTAFDVIGSIFAVHHIAAPARQHRVVPHSTKNRIALRSADD